ncbi:MAG: HAMP domain-containing sensor histidine kinase, partial [Candidatus Dormibacteraceae bacterium]
RWRGWVDTSDPNAPPRARPPWWPQGEPFPPERWRRGGPPTFIRRLGCLLLALLGLTALGGGVVGAWIGHTDHFPGAPLALLLVLILGLAVTGGMRRVSRPVANLTEASRRIEQGDYSAQVPESGPADVRSVARAFNSMSSRLKTVDERRRSFLADVTHELRTPLSVIRGQAEGIIDGVYPGDVEHIVPILDAAHALERLVEDLRTLALTDAGSLVLNKEPTDVGVLVHDTVESFRSQADSSGVILTSAIGGDLPPLGVDPARMRGAIGNLVSNAIRHTPPGGSVKVTITSAAGGVRITVADTGEGIPPDLLPHVFERFVKGKTSKGSGLGLAIAHDIVTAHGGTIEIKNLPERGTAATIELAPTAAR